MEAKGFPPGTSPSASPSDPRQLQINNFQGDSLTIKVDKRWPLGKYIMLEYLVTTVIPSCEQLAALGNLVAERKEAAQPQGSLKSSASPYLGLLMGTAPSWRRQFHEDLKASDSPEVENGYVIAKEVQLYLAVVLLCFDDLQAAVLVADILDYYYGTKRFKETLGAEHFWRKLLRCCLDHAVSAHFRVIWVLLKCLKYYLNVTFEEPTLSAAELEKLLELNLFDKPADAKAVDEETVTPMGSVVASPFDEQEPLLIIRFGKYYFTVPLNRLPAGTMLSIAFGPDWASDGASEPLPLPGLGGLPEPAAKGLWTLLQRLIPEPTLTQEDISNFCRLYPEVLTAVLSHQYLQPSEHEKLLKAVQRVLTVYIAHTNMSDAMPGLLHLAHFLVRSNLEPFKWTVSGFSNFLQLAACHPAKWSRVDDFLEDFTRLHVKALKAAEPKSSNKEAKSNDPVEQPENKKRRRSNAGGETSSSKRPTVDHEAKSRGVVRAGQYAALTATNGRKVSRLPQRGLE